MADKPEKKAEGVGPYNAAQFTHTSRTPAEFATLSQAARDKIMTSSQDITLHSYAMWDSAEEAVDNMTGVYKSKATPLSEVIKEGEKLPLQGKLDLVTKFMADNVNYTPMEEDAKHPRRPSAPFKDRPEVQDYAQTLKETLTSRSGDCEDFAIAQGELLMRMGVPPSDIQVVSGSVYNSKGEKEFGHVNLGVKISENKWDVIELVNDRPQQLSGNDYLQNGLGGHYFVPTSAVTGNRQPLTYEVPQSGMTPKDKFEGPAAQQKISHTNILDGIALSASNVPGGLSGQTPQPAQIATVQDLSQQQPAALSQGYKPTA